jgi:hypothetical protein
LGREKSTVGLVRQTPDGKAAMTEDPMEGLVYRVQPVPQVLMDFVFDYGSLSRAVEFDFIFALITARKVTLSSTEATLIADLVGYCFFGCRFELTRGWLGFCSCRQHSYLRATLSPTTLLSASAISSASWIWSNSSWRCGP